MIKAFKTLSAATLLAVAASTAGAVTVAPGDMIDNSGQVENGETLTFTYEVDAPVRIDAFDFGGFDSNAGEALERISIRTADGSEVFFESQGAFGPFGFAPERPPRRGRSGF